jgi:secreted PhoX family phosphatase
MPDPAAHPGPATAAPSAAADPAHRPGPSRRSFLGRSAATGLGIALVGSLDTVFGAGAAGARETARRDPGAPGYGPLVPDPDGRLSLPRGFGYGVVARSGVTLLDSGHPTPDRPDGTASFRRRGGDGSVLVSNHEIGRSPGANPVPHLDGLVYDPGAFGGTTTIEVDRHGRRVRQYVSLAGTDNNCAGGRTPWQTWLTCEETEDVPGPGNQLTKRHGYVFEVDPYDEAANLHPTPIKALGRFAHEAVVVDPEEHTLYLTEDAGGPNGLFYRWLPPSEALPLQRGALKALADDAGTLQAMRAFDRSGTLVPDLSAATEVGTTYRVRWATVPDRDATAVAVRKQFTFGPTIGAGGDVTRSRKLEGAWWGDGGAYFVSSFARTTDGSVGQHDGQVWFLDPLAQTVQLRLRFAYTPADQDGDPDGPDNITVSPYGGVILAEDGDGRQHLVGATEDGEAFFFARNELPGSEEFTGPNFSPDKRILFANVQTPGHVFAIQGPWRKDHRDRDEDDRRRYRD